MKKPPPVDSERIAHATKLILARAARAAKDPIELQAFVFRSEETGKQLDIYAHAQVMSAFVQAHRLSVVRGFPGCGKTLQLASQFLHRLGTDPRQRFAIVSSSKSQAQKPLSLIASAIENEGGAFPELRVVFPHLRRSKRRGDKWTQSAITVARPPGIRDPSLVAFGHHGRTLGARLNGVAIDDILNEENTATPELREKTNHWVLSTLVTRRGVSDLWISVWNVPWVDGSSGETPDLTYALEIAGWPTLEMPIDGEIKIANTDWAASRPDLLRPSLSKPGTWRLVAHDDARYGTPLCMQLPGGEVKRVEPSETKIAGARYGHFDIDDEVYLWPEKFGAEEDKKIRESLKAYPDVYWSSYRMKTRRKAGREEKRRWFERAKEAGRLLGIHTLSSAKRPGSGRAFTGFDLAFGLEEQHDLSALFTFEVVPKLVIPDDKSPSGVREVRNARVIVDIQVGRWTSKEKAERAVETSARYGSILRVETNGAQMALKEWIVDLDASAPVKAHTTGEVNKAHRLHGIASVFFELENGAWVIPCRPDGSVDENVQLWIDQMLDYDPDKHVGDVAIAGWLARSQARETLGSGFAPDLRAILDKLRRRPAA